MSRTAASHISIDDLDNTPLAADDPRAAMARAVWAARHVIARVDVATATRSTPCPDWNALDLARHLIAVFHRASAGPTGREIVSMPILAPGDVDGLDAAVLAAAHQVRTNWADDATLQTMIDVPWGEFPGAAVIGAYAGETLVHTWDLAVSLDVTLDWPEVDLPAHLAMVQQGIPEQPRDETMPFDAVVRPSSDAPLIEHFVGWMGRDVDRWRVAR